jgi:hypothetical protein
MDQFAVNPVAGDRPSSLRFRRFADARWAGVAAASSLAAFAGFVPLALAQERPSATPLPVQIELSPTSPENSEPQALPALELPATVLTPETDAPQNPVGQIDTQRPELPFSDVPPDHWAYEALLYLSTGGRSPRSIP